LQARSEETLQNRPWLLLTRGNPPRCRDS
jgi:hypothetical protein